MDLRITTLIENNSDKDKLENKSVYNNTGNVIEII